MNLLHSPVFLALTLVQLISLELLGQDKCWTVLIHKKGKDIVERDNMSTFDERGFYLMRNCAYHIKTSNNHIYFGRLVDVKPDSLFFTTFINEEVYPYGGYRFDTIGIHYTQLKELGFNGDFSQTDDVQFMKHFKFVFDKSSENCRIISERAQVYSDDSTEFELIPFLDQFELKHVYVDRGIVYDYYGYQTDRFVYSSEDSTYRKGYGIWFTPCSVEKINGLAIGFKAINLKNKDNSLKDSLQINGVSLEIFPVDWFDFAEDSWIGRFPDSVNFYRSYVKEKTETKIKGISCGLIRSNGCREISGLNIAGIYSTAIAVRGVSLSGLSNFAYEFNGLSVASIVNRATIAKGVQIGLVNKAADLRGVQIGLWNINGRRSLPFINWQFEAIQ